MQIVRWFMSHPIIAAWALAGLAIVLNLGVGGGDKDVNHAAATNETTTANTEHHASTSTEEVDQTPSVSTAVDTAMDKAKAAAVGAVPQAPKAPEAPTAHEMPVPASVVASLGEKTKTAHETPHKASDEKPVDSTVEAPKVTITATTPKVSIEATKVPVPVTAPVADATKIAPTAPAVPAAPAIPVAPAAAPEVVATPTAPAKIPAAVPTPAPAVSTTDAHVAVTPTPAAPKVETVQIAPATPVVTATTATVTSTPVVQNVAVSAATATTSSKPVLTGFEGKTPTELLQHARMAFNQKEMDKSVAIYQYLIKQQPNVIEYKGELGNVFYHQNKPKEAAALYAEIALPLIQQGKGSQVSNMLGFIGAFYPEKATEISKRLMGK